MPSIIVHRIQYHHDLAILSVNQDFPQPAVWLLETVYITTSLFSVHNTFNQHKCLRIEKVTASALSLLESQAFCAKCVHSFFERSATFECTSPTGTNHSYSVDVLRGRNCIYDNSENM